MPLQKQDLCTKSKITKCICIVVIISLFISLFKPILHYLNPNTCTLESEKKGHRSISFTLDTIYAILATIIPCNVILFLNIMIGKTLVTRSKTFTRLGKSTLNKKSFNHQYGVILITISLCYFILNIPYTINWVLLAIDNSNTKYSSILTQTFYLTKTIFYLNYCANFFLYNLTLASFRRCFLYSFFGCNTDETQHPNRSVSLNQ